jgi:hypothetical protein
MYIVENVKKECPYCKQPLTLLNEDYLVDKPSFYICFNDKKVFQIKIKPHSKIEFIEVERPLIGESKPVKEK